VSAVFPDTSSVDAYAGVNQPSSTIVLHAASQREMRLLLPANMRALLSYIRKQSGLILRATSPSLHNAARQNWDNASTQTPLPMQKKYGHYPAFVYQSC
jgi:hypothetical protein